MAITGRPDDLPTSAHAFRSGTTLPTPTVVQPTTRLTKTVRISPTHNQKLRDVAADRTKASGVRCNESDVLADALDFYFKHLNT